MSAPLLVLLLALSVGTPPTGAALERDAREIDAMLIAPCCFSQQVSVHPSAAAQEVKQDVRRRIAAGETQRQILDAYVAHYGKRILAEPPAAGFDLTLYVMPIVGFFVSVGAVVVIVRRLTTRVAKGMSASASGMPTTATSPDENARLDDELRDLD